MTGYYFLTLILQSFIDEKFTDEDSIVQTYTILNYLYFNDDKFLFNCFKDLFGPYIYINRAPIETYRLNFIIVSEYWTIEVKLDFFFFS